MREDRYAGVSLGGRRTGRRRLRCPVCRSNDPARYDPVTYTLDGGSPFIQPCQDHNHWHEIGRRLGKKER